MDGGNMNRLHLRLIQMKFCIYYSGQKTEMPPFLITT